MFYCLEENLSECTCQKTNVNLRERSFMIISKIRWHILATQVLVEKIVFFKVPIISLYLICQIFILT